jgi:hypothetical protein
MLHIGDCGRLVEELLSESCTDRFAISSGSEKRILTVSLDQHDWQDVANTSVIRAAPLRTGKTARENYGKN